MMNKPVLANDGAYGVYLYDATDVFDKAARMVIFTAAVLGHEPTDRLVVSTLTKLGEDPSAKNIARVWAFLTPGSTAVKALVRTRAV